MKDQLFDSEEKREAAIITFTTGKDNPFWKLMTQILEANIEVVTEQILEGSDTKEETDRLRDKLKVYKELLNTPAMMIERLTPVEGEEPNLDPYY